MVAVVNGDFPASDDVYFDAVVIGPDGVVRKVFSGNDWTPDDLLSELRSAL